jgi:hypothetical protein
VSVIGPKFKKMKQVRHNLERFRNFAPSIEIKHYEEEYFSAYPVLYGRLVCKGANTPVGNGSYE